MDSMRKALQRPTSFGAGLPSVPTPPSGAVAHPLSPFRQELSRLAENHPIAYLVGLPLSGGALVGYLIAGSVTGAFIGAATVAGTGYALARCGAFGSLSFGG